MKNKFTEFAIIPRQSTHSRSAWIKCLMAAFLILSVAFAETTATLELGSTSNFAILAGSLVSNVPTSAITGDVGLSPLTGANITGFGGLEVTGTFYTVDAAGPAGYVQAATKLSNAKGDLTTAFNNAAGRSPTPTGQFLDTLDGEIGGLTLVPGLYKFSGGLTISSNTTLTGSASDIWIFQIASTLNVGSGKQVILSGGALADNIFWQVGTSATLETGSVTRGTILADQSIDMKSGATLYGRALASTGAVTIASSTITNPTPDQSLPVTLSAFSAKMVKGSVQLSWSTSSEIENLGFTLSRKSSSDGEKWPEFYENIATYSRNPDLQGQGSTTREHDYQYTDALIRSGLSYEYRLSDVDYRGHVVHHTPIQIKAPSGEAMRPQICELGRIYPNPFNPATTIPYRLLETAQVNISILSLQGEWIATLADGNQDAGNYDLTWSPQNLSSGIYLARIEAGGMIAVNQVVFIK